MRRPPCSNKGNFREAHTRSIEMPDMSGPVLEKVCQYLHYQHRRHHAARMGAPSPATASDPVDAFTIPPHLCKDTLVAACYLDL
jgi:hypothetical protein